MSPSVDDRGVIVSCPSCGQSNRIRFEQLASSARCSRCKTALEAAGRPLDVQTSGVFDALVSRSSLPVVVDCWAPWCGPCRAVAPEIEKLAAKRQGQWLVVKVNTDELQEVARRFQIVSIPTLLIFADGAEIDRAAGARPAAEIERFIEGSLADAARARR